jgi:ribosomal protein L11 methyltransferase
MKYPYLEISAAKKLEAKLTGILWDHSLSGIEEEAHASITKWRVYFEDSSVMNHCIQELKEVFREEEIRINTEEIADSWSHNLNGHFETVELNFCRIEPYKPDHERPTKSSTIQIYPGRGYGTGNHSTTRMCLDFIAEMKLENLDFLDFGCGSGVLSLAALKKGAKRGVAVDIDADAVENAGYNLEINHHVAEISLHHGSIETIKQTYPGKTFPIVFANLNSQIIPSLLAQGLPKFVAPEGKLVLSGIHLDTMTAISSLFPQYQLQEVSWKRHRQWTTALLKRA